MAYVKTNWQNGVTPVNADNMNKIENELEALDQASGGSENALVKPSTPPNVIEIVGIDTSGNQVRIQVDTTEFVIDGSASPYTLKKKAEVQGETWVFNSTPNGEELAQTYINGICNVGSDNEVNFTWIKAVNQQGPQGQSIYIATDVATLYNFGWQGVEPAIRTIYFSTSPTGELLTWLQANAVKQ